MFTLDAIEKSLYSWASPDRVPDAIKNRFSMAFGSPALDNRLQVKISESQIQFFYYDHDYLEWNPNGVQDNDYFKEVGFVTLTSPKDIGNDILKFPQNIGGLDLYEETGLLVLIEKTIEQRTTEFYDFPFIDNYNTKKRKKEKKEKTVKASTNGENLRANNYGMFRCFMQCCLLDFIYEFEIRSQNFVTSPIYDHVRGKLHESDVYKLLSAKIQYTQYLYKNQHLSRNQDKYTYYTQKYADYLMDQRLNKVIPPDNFIAETEERQGWFYNPEEELELLLKTNCKHEKNKSTQNVVSLKESLVAKIQSFFYTKHAVLKAMTTKRSKCGFRLVQFLMLLFNALLIVASCRFDQCWWNGFFIVVPLFAGIILGILVFISLKKLNGVRSRFSNTFFLRIIVAEATAWFTIGIVDDLVKSMLWIEQRKLAVFIVVIIVLILVLAVVFGKVKHHSPYCNTRTIVEKSLVILNHSMFFAFVMGCIMQFVFYSNLLKNSDILSGVVYRNHFVEVEDYLGRLNDLEKSINDYRDFTRDFDFTNTQISGDNTGEIELNGDLFFYNHDSVVESASLSLEHRISIGSNMVSMIGIDISKYHNELVDNIISCIQEVNNPNYMLVTFKIERMAKDEENYSVICNILKRNLEAINSQLSLKLKTEIREAKNHLMDSSYETLIKWATANDSINDQTQSASINKLIADAKTNKCCVKVPYCKDRYFYPYLLLFHTLIVLVLAFITQLIISDKSVTEPL